MPATATRSNHTSREERLAVVEEHVQQENQHDLDGIMVTFGEDAWYDDDESREDHHNGEMAESEHRSNEPFA